MTKITVFKDHDGRYLGFTCLGHAGYADAGEDIVCAGISALVINTVNALEQFTGEVFETDADVPGEIAVRFRAPAGHDAELLMKSLVLGLQGIQTTYGNEFIVLEFKEV